MASRLTLRYPTGSPDAIGAELRAIRKHLNISQRLFASRLGVHRTSLARWEAGLRPTPIVVLHLARFLAEAHVPPVTFMPDPRVQQVSLVPTHEYWWRDYAGITCDGPHSQLQCVVSRRRRLVASACAAHLWPVYQLVEAKSLALERQEAHRQARLAVRQETRHQAREGTTAPAAADPTT
jgi:transcriptional regulator with XRE-family HTH domain